MLHLLTRRTPPLVLVLCAPVFGFAPEDEPAPRFNRDVRPILSNHCFECHGPDANQRQAALRLDQDEGLFGDRGGYRVVVPGDAPGSELARRITATDEAERMPPADFRHSLDEDERTTLLRWIASDGTSEAHWAYEPPQRRTAPEVEERAWSGAIDSFLFERMTLEGVAPAPDADRRALARRLSFDLTGLPPEPEDVDAFVLDEDEGAYARFVDALLASPHYGERMTLFWLDLVRYADTTGYHGDQEWRVSPYRDWVIRAFNDNVPFDEFTIDQLGGDLLPSPTLDQRVAATYNRLNMVTFEGGSQAKEFLAKYAADRVRTTANVWLGSTMGCAECHDHKFDPFSTHDFYSLAAFFADIQEEGVYTRFDEGFVPPEMKVPSPEQAQQIERLDAERAWAARLLAADTRELRAARDAWESDLRERLARTDESVDTAWIDDEQSNGGSTEGRWDFVEADAAPVKFGTRSRLQRGDGLVQHFFLGAERKLVLSDGDRLFAWVWLDPQKPPKTIMLQVHFGNWEHRAFWGEDLIPFGSIGADAPQHRPMGALPEAGGWARLEVDPGVVGLKAGDEIDGLAFTQHGGAAYWDRAGVHTSRPLLAIGGPPRAVLAAFEAEVPTPDEHATIDAYWRGVAGELTDERALVQELEQRYAALDAEIPRTLATISVEARPMRVLPRGNWMDDSGELVDPDVPHFLPGLEQSEARATRLDLGRWLVSDENPLTARVLVNRLWRLYFGEGLARSVDDLGSQGEWPDHLELLDWLALELVDSGWDVKAMIKRMVTSSAYRQSSAPRPEHDDVDPDNRLFARQTRRRLAAELIRDSALAYSGLLVRTIGGPSVKPYQPAGYWAELNFPKRTWQHDKGDALYRRGMYTFWCRTFLHPTLKAFDAPAREECTARRPESNTPLQALALLNDPAFVEAARVLAARVLRETPRGDDATRLERLYKRVLSRSPRAGEASICLTLLRGHRGQYDSDPAAARALGSEGEFPSATELDEAELAAWTSVARSVLNTNEAISRR